MPIPNEVNASDILRNITNGLKKLDVFGSGPIQMHAFFHRPDVHETQVNALLSQKIKIINSPPGNKREYYLSF